MASGWELTDLTGRVPEPVLARLRRLLRAEDAAMPLDGLPVEVHSPGQEGSPLAEAGLLGLCLPEVASLGGDWSPVTDFRALTLVPAGTPFRFRVLLRQPPSSVMWVERNWTDGHRSWTHLAARGALEAYRDAGPGDWPQLAVAARRYLPALDGLPPISMGLGRPRTVATFLERVLLHELGHVRLLSQAREASDVSAMAGYGHPLTAGLPTAAGMPPTAAAAINGSERFAETYALARRGLEDTLSTDDRAMLAAAGVTGGRTLR